MHERLTRAVEIVGKLTASLALTTCLQVQRVEAAVPLEGRQACLLVEDSVRAEPFWQLKKVNAPEGMLVSISFEGISDQNFKARNFQFTFGEPYYVPMIPMRSDQFYRVTMILPENTAITNQAWDIKAIDCQPST